MKFLSQNIKYFVISKISVAIKVLEIQNQGCHILEKCWKVLEFYL